MVALASRFGRYGYRRVTALLRQEGWRVNHKRVERLWRQEGLKVPALPVHGFLGHLIGAGCPCGGGIHDRLSGGNERA